MSHNPALTPKENEKFRNPTATDANPQTPTMVKEVRKTFVHWIVPIVCSVMAMAIFALVKTWADDRYTLKRDYQEEVARRTISDAEEVKKREALQEQVEKMDRKLDLILYILQNEGKIPPNTIKSP